MSIKNNLLKYIENPNDPKNMFDLGVTYFNEGQTAMSISMFLKCAEHSDNTDIVYESLLKVAQSLKKQKRRNYSELGVYLQALNVDSNRPEAYFLISQLYERLGDWLNAYTYANIGTKFDPYHKVTKTHIDYQPLYGNLFQKAVTSWWIGNVSESAELFYKLADEYGHHLTPHYKKLVLNNINLLGLRNHKHLIHYYYRNNELKVKFKGYKKIQRNYSQAYQDLFVLTMLKGKENGKFLEIGSGNPIYGSNTYLLEKEFNWSGVSIDIDSKYKYSFENDRKSNLCIGDATTLNYNKLISDNNIEDNVFDYLQLDCDPPENTYKAMLRIPFNKFKFAVITYEHDDYTNQEKDYKKLSREYLSNKGYVLVVNNVAPDRLCSFEDWWVHPDLVDEDVINKMKYISNEAKKPTDFMLIW